MHLHVRRRRAVFRKAFVAQRAAPPILPPAQPVTQDTAGMCTPGPVDDVTSLGLGHNSRPHVLHGFFVPPLQLEVLTGNNLGHPGNTQEGKSSFRMLARAASLDRSHSAARVSVTMPGLMLSSQLRPLTRVVTLMLRTQWETRLNPRATGQIDGPAIHPAPGRPQFPRGLAPSAPSNACRYPIRTPLATLTQGG